MLSLISGFLGFVIPVISLSRHPITGLLLSKEQQNIKRLIMLKIVNKYNLSTTQYYKE